MSKIEWTEQTWNPVVGCSVVSPGCTNCYAMKMAARLEAMGTPRYAGLTKPTKAGAVWTGELRLVEEALTLPLRRRKPTTYFVNSMSDLFHESVPDAWIDRVFAVMALAPQHTFQVLTKRSARMRAYMANALGRTADAAIALRRSPPAGVRGLDAGAVVPLPHVAPGQAWWPLPNLWLGVSTEDQRWADVRVPDLLATPAAVRFVSAEPLLGHIDFGRIVVRAKSEPEEWAHYLDALTGDIWDDENGIIEGALAPEDHHRLDWIIVGGESGPNARPMHPAWARSIRDQCAAAGVAYHFKQWGGWREPAEGEGYNTLHGRAGKPPAFIVAEDGTVHCTEGRLGQRTGAVMVMVGKKAAGRLLDGVEHNGFPASHRGDAP